MKKITISLMFVFLSMIFGVNSTYAQNSIALPNNYATLTKAEKINTLKVLINNIKLRIEKIIKEKQDAQKNKETGFSNNEIKEILDKISPAEDRNKFYIISSELEEFIKVDIQLKNENQENVGLYLTVDGKNIVSFDRVVNIEKPDIKIKKEIIIFKEKSPFSNSEIKNILNKTVLEKDRESFIVNGSSAGKIIKVKLKFDNMTDYVVYLSRDGKNFTKVIKNSIEEMNQNVKKAQALNLNIKKRLEVSDIDLKKVSSEDKVFGDQDAEIFIVEYSDLECPFCKRFDSSLNSLKEKYKNNDKIAFVFRNFPLDSLHPTARKEAEAVQCVKNIAGNDKTFDFIDRVFEESKSNGKFDLEKLPEIASELGINKNNFEKCLESEKVKKQVQNEYEDGIIAEVRGTPTVFIQRKDGKSVEIVSDIDKVEKEIDELLK